MSASDQWTTTSSGLKYQVIKKNEKGNTDKPKATSTVTVHYEGTLASNGKKFDSSYDREETISFGLNQVIKGWTEGLQLMSKGDKFKFYIPYNLAYGEQNVGNGLIPPKSDLVFVVELFDYKN